MTRLAAASKDCRELPNQPPILRRLILAFEQMRDVGKVAAFLRAYNKVVTDDPWAQQKTTEYSLLGLF